MITTGTMANAAAKGMLPATPTFSYTTFPMKLDPVPPTRNGVMKSPRVRENVKIDPATTPGSASGRITFAIVRPPRAPRSAEASRYESGIRSMAA